MPHNGGNRPVNVKFNGITYFSNSNGHLVFYGFYRDMQNFCDFFISHPVFFDKFEYKPAARRQLKDCCSDKQHHIRCDEQLFRIRVIAFKDAGELINI